jgi:hypothetical protein
MLMRALRLDLPTFLQLLQVQLELEVPGNCLDIDAEPYQANVQPVTHRKDLLKSVVTIWAWIPKHLSAAMATVLPL